MERLEFGGSSRYIAIEAAIHIARYLTAKDLCSGRKVLDIACGEGYGSWLMAEWGAQSVLGVDVSPEAVAAANKRFSNERVRFVASPGEQLTQITQEQKFDLIVSLETIEHVDDPELFLKNIRDVAAPNATIIISAPNDYWYYDLGGQNEFHKRRFTLEEFQALAEKVLGKADSWNLGTLGIGFSVAEQHGKLKSGDASTPQDAMLEFQSIDSAVYVPSQIESDATPAEAAFYVGVWGAAANKKTIFAGYPVSMNLGRQVLFPRDGIWAIKPDPLSRKNDESVRRLLAKELEETLARESAQKEQLAALQDAVNSEIRKLEEARTRELALTGQIESLNASLIASTEQLEQAKAQEAVMNSELVVLTKSVESYSEKLHFTEKEVERLGMSRRAAQAEVAAAWRAIYRHEHSASELRATLDHARQETEHARHDADAARREFDATRRELDAARSELESTRRQLNSMQQDAAATNQLHNRMLDEHRLAIQTANGHLARVPWNVVRAWWLIRKAIPNAVLKVVGALLNSVRRSHAI
ncbi:class I SAM-dependent methyltransferase [Caballeronia ptereochthonis]|uniref:Type 11 methyltransferase n=1 Tax=Caballeronia ptereochthonis TaxID=1777144 RepID=A0A158A770_9BURK|nr:class I SAM-dependent methyltransferase [Caballeronia ptereochthonis]SAK53535.1 type 11 methyltransferase [Caballeronia ptereochthonis]